MIKIRSQAFPSIRLAWLAVLLAGVSACHQPDVVRLPSAREMKSHDASNFRPDQLPRPRVVVLPSDVLSIRRDDQTTAEAGANDTYVVRPDGTFAFPYAGVVQAEGRSPEALGDEITARLSSIYRNPHVTVNIVRSPGNHVFVGGSVRNPGVFDLTAGVTVEQAITSTGGLLPTADARHVALIRLDDKGVRQVYFFDYAQILRDSVRPGSVPMLLQRGDLLFIPLSPIGRAVHTMDLYITQLLPWFRGVGLGLNYQVNDTSSLNYNSATTTNNNGSGTVITGTL
ncbi:polysaccharide biosynthesis/export family protein [Frateuria aurantia]